MSDSESAPGAGAPLNLAVSGEPPPDAAALEWALAYAARGMAVFPVKADKTPLTPRGVRDATIAESVIRHWWKVWPHADPAWAVPGEIVVVDLDIKTGENGPDEFARREGYSFEDVAAPMASTASGGRHLVFAAGDRRLANKVRVAPGIDLRSAGGYVVLPGARNGREWLNPLSAPLSLAPDWLTAKGDSEGRPAGEARPFMGEATAYAAGGLADACSKIAAAPIGEQNAILNKESFSIGGLVGGGELDEGETIEALTDAGMRMANAPRRRPWTERIVRRVVTEAIAKGAEKPRNTPDVDPEGEALAARLLASAAAKRAASNVVPLRRSRNSAPWSIEIPSLTRFRADILAIHARDIAPFQTAGNLAFAADPEPAGTPFDPETGEVIGEEPEAASEAAGAKAAADVEDEGIELFHPCGLTGEIVDWIEDSAQFPSRELALAAALAWIGTLAGRHFRTPTNVRSNLYVVSLAPSGYGKDHPASCIEYLAREARVDLLGPERFMSSSGLMAALRAKPSMLTIYDEVAGLLEQVDSPKASPHAQAIGDDLLKLFSKANKSYLGAGYAASSNTASAGGPIDNPNLSVLGMSTPKRFWDALASGRTKDGLAARFLLFNVIGPKPKRRPRPRLKPENPPQSIVDGVKDIGVAITERHSLGRATIGSPSAYEVPLSAEADDILAKFEKRIEAVTGKVDDDLHSIMGRSYEIALRLALIAAVGCDPRAPVIDRDIMRWAVALAWRSTLTLIEQITENVADTDRERDALRMLAIVRKAGKSGITKGVLHNRFGSKLDRQKRQALIDDQVSFAKMRADVRKTTTGQIVRYFIIERGE